MSGVETMGDEQVLHAQYEEVERAKAENRRLRDALFQFKYPPDTKMLHAIADEIDCGPRCEHGHMEWDTNAHVCSRENSKEGCASMKAWELRQFAAAIDACEDLRKSENT